MSIINAFDGKTSAMLNPEGIVQKSEYQIDTCIIMWQHKIMKELLEQDMVEEITSVKSGNGPRILYRVKVTNIGVYESPVGAPMTTVILEEFHIAVGIKNILAFGTCGVLMDMEAGKCIIPTHAYRDEGTSYHYLSASDYIQIKNADKLASIFDELGVGYIKGKTWTTDAIYRETTGNRDKRVSEGCVAVDMECSALQSVCDYRGLELYQFFYGADSLSGTKWDARILGNYEISKRMKFFYLALEIAKIIDERKK